MSACGQPEDESSTEGPAAPAPPRDLYVPKNAASTGTAVRVLTVVAYLLSVSLAAILLSVYYVCVWSPSVLPASVNHSDDVGQPLAQTAAFRHTAFSENGRSDSTIESEPPDGALPTSYENTGENAYSGTSETTPPAPTDHNSSSTAMAYHNDTQNYDEQNHENGTVT